MSVLVGVSPRRSAEKSTDSEGTGAAGKLLANAYARDLYLARRRTNRKFEVIHNVR